MGIVLGSTDMEYYKGIFVDLGCPVMYAETLAMGHIGMTALTKLDMDMKSLMLKGYPYLTAKSMVA